MVSVTFYSTSNDRRYLYKYLESQIVTTAELYDNTDIFNPELKVAWNNLYATTVNYFYISEFKRYYFIEDVVAEPGGAARIKGSIDVLQTYHNSIDQDEIVVTRAFDSLADPPNLNSGGTSWEAPPSLFGSINPGPTYVKDNNLPLKPNRRILVLNFKGASPLVIGNLANVNDPFFVLNIMGRTPGGGN